MQLCVSDMQQQKQLNLNARVCVPAGSSCLFSCPNVAGVSPCRPSYNNTRRAGTISGTICRYDLCVQQWAGRYGTRHGAAMSPTHPQLALTCSSYKLCHSYTCKGFQNEFLCQVKKIAFHANSFSANNWRSKSYKQHRWLNSV